MSTYTLGYNPPGHVPTATPPLGAAVKHDTGKPRVALVLNDFALALLEVSKVGTFGAAKYAEHNWLGLDISRIEDAKARHSLLDASGEKVDPETGYLHAAHEAWNALARLELILRVPK
jgi:uncharacterized protein involved in copper resistance